MSTEYVDSLDSFEELYLQGDLTRLKKLEEDRLKAHQQAKVLLEQESKKLIGYVKERLEEHDQAEKSIATFQAKLTQSQSIVIDLERTLRKLQKHAEQSRK